MLLVAVGVGGTWVGVGGVSPCRYFGTLYLLVTLGVGNGGTSLQSAA